MRRKKLGVAETRKNVGTRLKSGREVKEVVEVPSLLYSKETL